MSGFSSSDYDAQEAIERRVQEELRARQAAAASRVGGVGGALGHAGFAANPSSRFMTSLLAAETAAATSGTSPYYARAAHASPFSRPSPYASALGSAYGTAHSPSDAVAASLYARQRAQYGYGGAMDGYGVPGSHDLYSQQFGRSQQEMSLIDRAAAYNAQQRQAENAALLQQQQQQHQAHAPQQPPQQTPTAKSPPNASGLSAHSTPYMQKGSPKIPSPAPKPAPAPTPTQTSRQTSAPQTPVPSTPVPSTPSAVQQQQSTPASTGSRPTPQTAPRPRAKAPTPLRTPASVEKDKVAKSASMGTGSSNDMDGGAGDNGDNTKWFSGCVPLGLEDDKYWLSELQVYLRSNFAEAFGATEEDIAAPMHGRNKPIALGQVGIRCMHCKRKYTFLILWRVDFCLFFF